MQLHLAVTTTGPRRQFKERSGHSTQQLLTLIVGTSAVANNAPAPLNLPARWDPISRSDAAGRARTFANQATLVWTVESVVSYVSDVRRAHPALISDELAQSIGSVRDKASKLDVLYREVGAEATHALAIVLAGYVWRNRLLHRGSQNPLPPLVRSQLRSGSDLIRQDYQGLEVEEVITRIETSAPPRLKEVSSTIRAAGFLVREIDQRLISNIDPGGFLREHLRAYLQDVRPDRQMARAVGLWGGTEAATRRSLETYAVQVGMTRSDEAFEFELGHLTPSEAIAALSQ